MPCESLPVQSRMTTGKVISINPLMEETVKNAVAEITSKASVEESVDVYMALPKAVRRDVYNQLPGDLKKKVRAASEARRGIAFRTQDGDIVLSREEMKAQVLRLEEKRREMDTRKAILADRVVEIKKQAQKFYGDDFLAEVETALEQLQ